jgi:hypothetical protein
MPRANVGAKSEAVPGTVDQVKGPVGRAEELRDAQVVMEREFSMGNVDPRNPTVKAMVVTGNGNVGSAGHFIPKGTVVLVNVRSAIMHTRHGTMRPATSKEAGKAVDANIWTPQTAMERAIFPEAFETLREDLPGTSYRRGDRVSVAQLLRVMIDRERENAAKGKSLAPLPGVPEKTKRTRPARGARKASK